MRMKSQVITVLLIYLLHFNIVVYHQDVLFCVCHFSHCSQLVTVMLVLQVKLLVLNVFPHSFRGSGPELPHPFLHHSLI